MRKLILVPVLLVTIYCILWFSVASFIEHKVDHALSNLNSNKVQVLGGYTVKVSGFPFDFSLKLSKPHFRFIDNSKTSSAIYDVIFKGDFKLSVSWLLKSIDLVSDGGVSIIGIIDDYKFNISADAEKNTEYKINLYDTPLWGDGLRIVLALGEHPEYLLKLIKKIKIQSTKCHVSSTGNNQLLFTADKLKLDLETDFRDVDKSKFLIEQTIDNAQFTNASMILWQHLKNTSMFREILGSIKPEVSNYFSIFTLPQLGKINYFVDLRYKGDRPSANFDLKINKLQLQDNIMEIKLNGDISSDRNKLDLDLKSDSKFTDHWYQLMKQYAQTFKTTGQLKLRKNSSNISVFGSIIEGLKSIFAENSAKVYAAYVPKLQDFGWIHNQVKLSSKSNDNKSEFDVDIKNLTFEVEPYSLSINGNGGQRKDAYFYDTKLALNGYGLIINDVFAYLQRISSAVGHKFFIGGSALNLSEHSRFEIQSFVKQISDEPNANSIKLSLTASKSYNYPYPAVGKYTSQVFGLLWNKLIATIILNESMDKINHIQRILPVEMQDKLGGKIEKTLEPLKELLSKL